MLDAGSLGCKGGVCIQHHRYVFVAGLHRTGTSLVAKLIGSHPQIATIEGAPVPENEGCYLQGAIPHTARDGVPGHFATDAAQHMTEGHPLNTLETKLRLEHEWGRWFVREKPWRVEKSPVNITRMRLLQALFPLAQFVVVTRHPLFMAQALQKWSDEPVDKLARYGVSAYRHMLSDVQHLHWAVVMRYEDLVARPRVYAQGLEAFLDLTPAEMALRDIRDGNADYRPMRSDAGTIAELGYGDDGEIEKYQALVRHPLRAILEKTQHVLG